MGTNTGTPGFDIDGKTYEFDTADPSAPGIAPITTDHGDVKVDHSTKDFSKPTKTTLAQYLSDLTTGKQGHAKGTSNSYPIDPPANPVTEFDVSDDKGNPATLNDTGNSAHFAARGASTGTSTLSSDLQPRAFSPPTTPGATTVMPDLTTDPSKSLQGFVKGKQTTPGINGNQLLSSVGRNNLPAPIKTYTSAVMKANRFTDASAAAALISGLGNDGKPIGYDGTLHHPRYGDVTMNRLAQVGSALSLRASQELNAASPQNNPTGPTSELSALLPSPNQLGLTQVNAIVLEAADVLKTLTQEEVPSGDFLSIGDVSWGALNNVDDPFSGIDAIGMIALAAAMSAAVVLLFEGLGFLLNAVQTGGTGPGRNSSGRYVLGRFSVMPHADPNSVPPNFPPNVAQLLGIRPTNYPLGQALQAGTAAFFGIDTSTISSALASGITSAASSPGFNVVVARTIVRSSIVIEQAFKKLGSSPNPVVGITNTLDIVAALRTSKLIAAINVFATLGDVALTTPANLDPALDAIAEEPLKQSYIDAYPNEGPATTVQKNRLFNSIKLAWSSNRAPAMYLVPDSVASMQVLATDLHGFPGPVATTNDLSRTDITIQSKSDQAQNGPRLSTDQVTEMENKLDAEYVPFYFHDLRTNEIISFHAFLNSLTEDFTPQWENVDGFGRVDPIKIYKHTGRRISLSFYVAATSEEDFNDMWIKINKLITLVYPQYTQGRTLTNGSDTTFVQPFSQMIGASPLIRMRLGDMFRSNYSRFAMARLFGATDGTMQLPDNTGSTQNILFDGATNNLDRFNVAKSNLPNQIDANNRFTVDSSGWKLAPNGFALPNPLQGAGAPGLAGTTNVQAQDFNVRGSDLQFFEFEVTAVGPIGSGISVCLPHLLTADQIVDRFGVSSVTAGQINLALNNRYNNAADIKHCILGGGTNPGGSYMIPSARLTATRKTLEDLFHQLVFAFSDTTIDNIDVLNDFLSPEKNALIKSFESTAGKGLAGVLDSLNFDWHDRVPWEDKIGSKAPKMCKVTIAFSVIHDISPGIDWMGYNRAPVYPVGLGMSPSKKRQ